MIGLDGRRLMLLLALCGAGLASGCTLERTARRELVTYPPTEKILYVGVMYDLRQGTLAERPAPSARPSEDRDAPPDSALPRDQREIRVPVSEVRSVLADGLDRSELFARVLNPPITFAGRDPERMIQKAQESSDYLLVGEVNQFYIKAIGYNERAAISIPLDLLLGPISFGTFLSSAGNMYLFTGALMASYSAEVVLTLSVSLIDAGTGHAVHTFRIAERVRAPYDGPDAFGVMWDETDDWIDLGRRLGEVALHNASANLAARLAKVLETPKAPKKPPDKTGKK